MTEEFEEQLADAVDSLVVLGVGIVELIAVVLIARLIHRFVRDRLLRRFDSPEHSESSQTVIGVLTTVVVGMAGATVVLRAPIKTVGRRAVRPSPGGASSVQRRVSTWRPPPPRGFDRSSKVAASLESWRHPRPHVVVLARPRPLAQAFLTRDRGSPARADPFVQIGEAGHLAPPFPSLGAGFCLPSADVTALFE